jgi:spore germination protein GerM
MTIDGEEVQVQWFERARFEWHANNPPGYRVLLGRLGTQVIDTGGVNTVSQVALYFIARGDEGQSGIGIGCGDSAIPVEISIEPTPAPLTAAMEQLLAAQTEYYGQSGLYNALHRSTLSLERAAVENGVATIALSGNVIITGGECETPRFEAQIKQTARQFPTVDRVVVYINGQRMNDLLSAQ